MTKSHPRPGLLFTVCLNLLLLTAWQAAKGQVFVPQPDTVGGVIRILPDTSAPVAPVPPQGTTQWTGRSGIRQELIEADRLSAQGRFQDVVDFLLPVWKSEFSTRPDEAIAQALKRAYRSLKDYDGMRAIIRQQLDLNPQNPLTQADLADAYFSDNMNDSGTAVLERMLAAAPDDAERYQLAAQTYMRVGRSNEGVETYRKAREVLRDSTLFAEDMARFMEARREYAAAVEEYFRWLNAHPESQRTVQKHITNLIKVPQAGPQITAALERIIRAYPRHEYAHRLHADLLFESGRVDSAFAEYRRADNLAEVPGQHRLFGIERAIETRKYSTARDEAMAFLKDYPKHGEIIRVNLALARAELALGHPDVAVSMIKTLAYQVPTEPERLRIFYEVGEIYRRHTPDKDSARVYFMAVIDSPVRSPERTSAWLRLAEIAVFHGDLIGADSAYAHAGQSPAPAMREEIAFRSAELNFLRGEFEQCSAKMKEFMLQFPRGLYVNDAIKYTTIITDASEAMNWSLHRFSAGILCLRREMRDSALAAFAQLSQDSANALADEAQFSIGEVFESTGEFEQAIDAYRVVSTRFPESFMVPRAWARIGEVYADSIGDPAQARAAYQLILSDYKTSPVVEEARRRLQNLPVP